MNQVSEEIDVRILRILGLGDVFDLDYDTYLTLLKEALVKGSFGSSKIPDEELSLLANERKRIRGEKGRFTVKKQKITADKFATSKLLKPAKKSLLLAPKGGIGASGSIVGRDLLDISARLDDILRSLTEQNKLDKKSEEDKRKSREEEKRKRKESRLESGLKPIVSLAKKVLAPVQGILDSIVRFIVFTVLGRAFKLFMDWASDPKNREKIKVVGKFLKDWWPALLGAWFFFANPLGRFIRTVVGTVLKLTFQIGKFAIPKLLSFIRTNPLIAAGAAAGLATFGASMWKNNEENRQIKKEASKRNVNPESVKSELNQSKSSIWGMFGEAFSSIGPFGGLAGGGKVDSIFSGPVDHTTGSYVSGAGPDTQFFPIQGGGGAVLQKGESVLQVGARERMIRDTGVDPLAYNIGPNANKPRTLGNNILASSLGGVLGYAGGGVLGQPDFWKLAAVAAREDMRHPQGQADVAQSIYNRAAIGAYPGGKSIGNIITAAQQYEPTFANSGAWRSIRDRKTAIAATGFADKVDMAVKSITNPLLQQNARNFVGGRTDFMGESQKPNMKSGDITRGKNHNFFGWFYDAHLPQPAPVPKIPNSPSTSSGKPKVKKGPNFMERLTSGISSMFGKTPRYKNGGSIEMPQSDIPRKRFGGTLIGEQTGINIPGKEDRQMINVAVQPGEAKYIFTRTATQRGAVGLADLIQAKLDPSGSKVGMSGKYALPPPKRGGSRVQVLPPIKKSGGKMSRPGQAPETVVPSFSVISSVAYSTRSKIIETYGIM